MSALLVLASLPVAAQQPEYTPRPESLYEAALSQQELLELKISTLEKELQGMDPCDFKKSEAKFGELSSLIMSTKTKWEIHYRATLERLAAGTRRRESVIDLVREEQQQLKLLINEATRELEDTRRRLELQLSPIAKIELEKLASVQKEELDRLHHFEAELVGSSKTEQVDEELSSILRKKAEILHRERILRLNTLKLRLLAKKEQFSRKCSPVGEVK